MTGAPFFHVQIEKRSEYAMKRPFAYITAAWSDNEYQNTEEAAKYCRAVYDAGFTPICPLLFLPMFLNDAIPQEHKDGIDMGRDFLRRSHVLVVCGHRMTSPPPSACASPPPRWTASSPSRGRDAGSDPSPSAAAAVRAALNAPCPHPNAENQIYQEVHAYEN